MLEGRVGWLRTLSQTTKHWSSQQSHADMNWEVLCKIWVTMGRNFCLLHKFYPVERAWLSLAQLPKVFLMVLWKISRSLVQFLVCLFVNLECIQIKRIKALCPPIPVTLKIT